MNEKRSLFEIIFGKRPRTLTGEHTQLKMLNEFVPIFTQFGTEPYDSDVVRSAIDSIARNAAKLKPKHIRRANGSVVPQYSNLERLLQVRPNQYMDAYTFYYKVVTQLFVKNNAFVFIDYAPDGSIRGFYPIVANYVELFESRGQVFAKFQFITGENVTLPYTELIHLRRFFYKNDFWGENNYTALSPTLDLITTTNQGIINSVKSSAFIRGILKFTQSMMKPSDIKAERDRFVSEYLSIDNNGGIGAIDAKADFIPMKNEPVTVDEKQQSHIKNSIYDYFGTNDAIIQSRYSEDQWNAFYESTLEPIAIQMSLEFTSKLFSDRERGFGNEIIFESNRLQYASNTSKINLVKETMPFGLLTINEAREIFNLGPVEDGEKRLVSLNYVDSTLQNQYQLGGDSIDNQG